jgi:uncharacterized membrane protein YheB (UPF0754 family)
MAIKTEIVQWVFLLNCCWVIIFVVGFMDALILREKYWVLFTMPFISGAIGWFTNFVAVKMLLKPRCPVRFLGLKIQGLLPRRHTELANRISSAITKDFLTEENIIAFIDKADTAEALKQFLRRKWDEQIQNVLANIPMVGMFFSPEKLEQIRDNLMDAVGMDRVSLQNLLVEALTGKVDLESSIRDNILAFDMERLERIINEIAKKEFRYIERLGGIIGFTIGLVQVVLVMLFFRA